ncbi:MAG: amino acid-binding ACT domain protein, partial [Actinomyces sp.]
MSYLIRVVLPDTPGSLGELAEAFGMLDANIKSVDIVETTFADEKAVVTDDIVVELP